MNVRIALFFSLLTRHPSVREPEHGSKSLWSGGLSG